MFRNQGSRHDPTTLKKKTKTGDWTITNYKKGHHEINNSVVNHSINTRMNEKGTEHVESHKDPKES